MPGSVSMMSFMSSSSSLWWICPSPAASISQTPIVFLLPPALASIRCGRQTGLDQTRLGRGSEMVETTMIDRNRLRLRLRLRGRRKRIVAAARGCSQSRLVVSCRVSLDRRGQVSNARPTEELCATRTNTLVWLVEMQANACHVIHWPLCTAGQLMVGEPFDQKATDGVSEMGTREALSP